MARFNYERGSPREAERPFEVYDSQSPSPPIATMLTRPHAERIEALLNATVDGGGGGTLAPLTRDELHALVDNATSELRKRSDEAHDHERTALDDEIDRDYARGAGLAGDG